MRRTLALAAVAAVAVVAGPACGKGKDAAQGAQGLESPAPPFNADAAFALLKQQVAFGPRVPGTPGHQRQLDWMVKYLKQRADTVILQSFTAVAPNGDTLHLTNVFARFKPSNPDHILLLAHWDTRPTADNETNLARRAQPILGANDGASGVAVLMQLADDLKRHSPPLGVDLLFVDGEDYTGDMYLGSEQFAASYAPTYHPLYGILLDMVGDQNPSYPIEPSSQQYAPEVVQRVYDMAEKLGLGQYFPRSPGIEILDDHIPLNKAGIHTVDLIDFAYGPDGASNEYWHTLQDTVAHCSPAGLAAVGRVVGAMIYSGG
jgi:Zn-dependent M28 family amino/carboxypeptidase